MEVHYFKGISPQRGARVYCHPQSCVIGEVSLGDDVSIWPMAVLRGDVNRITIGRGTNIQDNSTLHVSHKTEDEPDGHPIVIGEYVTVGHQVMLHGCTIGSYCLIGIGAIVLDGAVIPDYVFLAAGSLVPPRKILERGYLYMGNPVKKVRPLTPEEMTHFKYSAEHYIKLKNEYLSSSEVDHSDPLINAPYHWQSLLPWPHKDTHKYDRGHTLVVAGPIEHAGAAKLAGFACLRTGSGLVTLVCAPQDEAVYATGALSLMTASIKKWEMLLEDARCNTVIIGPGAGVSEETREHVLSALKAEKALVIDADALMSFEHAPSRLFEVITSPCILTPHTGEFARLFAEIDALNVSRQEKAQKAAKLAGAVVILKGAETVIASPEGRVRINRHAPATLATAGTGDVLAGICAGLLAQGMEVFEAACAAVWIHGEAASQQKAGLIAEDLLKYLPEVLEGLKGD